MNTLKLLRNHIDNTAMAINDHDYGRSLACALYHGTRGAWLAFGGASGTALALNRRRAAGPLAVLAAAAGTAQLLLEAAHSIAVAYPGHPCSRCPQPDEPDTGNGDGGAWLDTDWDDIPPAPAPMPDIDDRISDWANDLDTELTQLLADTQIANRNGDPR